MSGRRLKAAVIGTGHLGRHHARNMARIDGVELVAICDPDEQRGQAAAQLCGSHWVAELTDLPSDLDLVSIAAPTPLHHEIALHFVGLGVHCLVEKPMCATLEQARDLAARVDAAGVLVQVGHIERFNPVLEHLKVPGPLRHVDARRLAPYPGRSVETSVVYDLMVHDIDLVLGWIGEPLVELRASGGAIRGPKPDWASCHLRFPSGATASIAASRLAAAPRRSATLYTDQSTHEVDFQGRTVDSVAGDLVVHSAQGDETEPLFRELAHFVECVRTGATPRVSHREGLAAIELADQVERAITGA